MNQKLTYLAALLSLPLFTFAQFRWDVGGGIGASNYLGDIGGMEQTRRDFIADLKLSQTHVAAEVFARYKLSPGISVKTAFAYGRISGADNLSTNPGRQGRNLSFRNDLFELSAAGQFCFYNIPDLGHSFRYSNDFKAYIFAGLAGFYSNPKAYYSGEWIELQPLQTEGVHYSKLGLSIPAGAGFYFTINKQNRIGWELGWRTTFTDYLDDISTQYADPSRLSPLAAKLANRNNELIYSLGELPNPGNYAPGNKRGDPTHNDAYIFTTLSYSYVIKGMSNVRREWKHTHPRYHNIIFNDKYGYGRRKIRIKL